MKYAAAYEGLSSIFQGAFRTLCAELPVPFSFWDGRRTKGPRRLQRLFEAWARSETCRVESESVYGIYDGGDFVDVGSAEGWFACLLAPKARAGDTFVLCEPDPRAIPRLHQNVAFLAREFADIRFVVLPVAVGDGLCCAADFPMGPSGHARFVSGKPMTNVVKSWRLDDIVVALGCRPQLVKIDVEGAEGQVLAGGPNPRVRV